MTDGADKKGDLKDVKETPDAKAAGGGALDDDDVWGDVEDPLAELDGMTDE